MRKLLAPWIVVALLMASALEATPPQANQPQANPPQTNPPQTPPAAPASPPPAKTKPTPTAPAPAVQTAPVILSPAAQAALDAAAAQGLINNNAAIGNLPQRSFPQASYFQHVANLYDGEYKKALEGFRFDYSFGLQAAGTHWVDSICYLTMAGECHYKLGQLDDALDDYNSALKLYLAFPNWMIGIGFPTTIQPQSNPKPSPWGKSDREAKIGHFPATMALASDTVLVDTVPMANGGNNFILPGTPVPVNVQEIARCTALALKRRHELMGPVCANDPLTSALESLFVRRPATDHPCAQAWIDADLAMAYLGTGQIAQAVGCLTRSTTMADAMDHPLTPIVLLEQGQLALDAGNYKDARDLLEEASYSAFEYGDLGVIEEAFRSGQQVWLATHPNGPGIFPPLAAAIAWSKSHGRELCATLLLLAAENHALLNDVRSASAALADARSVIGRREMGSHDVGARLNYLSAMLDYQQAKVTAGDQALADALGYQKTGSKWLFQISLADRFAAEQSGSPLSRKRTLPMYETLLRDPTSADWSADPLEALSVLATAHPSAYEHWFEIARQQAPELGLEVADRARRHRFLSTLPLGGRLTALRWVLEAPLERIGPESRMQRQELLLRYPRYAELAKHARQVRDDLAAKPLAAVGADAQRTQAEKLAELGRLSAEQEALLDVMALRRESAAIEFPPVRKTKEVQAALTSRQLLFAFFATHDNTYAWLVSKNRLAAWKIESPPPLLEKTVANLLRAIGNIDANHELTRIELADEAWRGESRDALEALVAGSKVNLAANIDEIAIVPDGVLWYLPFEALEVAKGNPAKETVPLLMKSRIRYLPMMGLAVPDRQERRGLGAVGVALGKLHPRDDSQIAETEFDRLIKLAPSVSPIRRSLPSSAPLYGSLFDTLVVLDDVSINGKPAAGSDRLPYYDWTPIQLDRARGTAPISQWFPLPWKNSIVILPGFHTPAENSLRQPGAGPPGSDLFLSTCGLMSTGARTVLISRWRMGGQSSCDLVHQFAQELPYSSAADAWQRAVETVRETPLDADREPRVKRSDREEPATARHPIFWSGYMVVDTGWTPPTSADGLAAKK
ncbi:MAG TPA: hypothetical protein VG056_10370 [Pirellulales bacterium]|nr:hypothetical protein [Pirellulales bacterium]